MIGNLIVEATAQCRADPGDLCGGTYDSTANRRPDLPM
jgi:hypothetical protein